MSSRGKSPQSSRVDIRHIESPNSYTMDDLAEHYALYPNKWARWRRIIREPAAEFLGTMILILFGDGVVCQVILPTGRMEASMLLINSFLS